MPLRRFAWLVAVLLQACASLEDVPREACGNQVREANEDCDGFAAYAGSACRPPGIEGQCHYDCRAAACPPGWGCGGDGICRAANGSYEPLTSLASEPLLSLDLHDFDGDGRVEPLAIGLSSGRVFFFDRAGQRASVQQLSLDIPIPVAAELSEDPHADLVVPFVDDRIGVLLGQSDQSLVAKAYASFQSDFGDAPLVVAHEPVEGRNEGDELLALAGSDVVLIETKELVHELPRDVAELAGEPQIGLLTRSLPCEELVLAYPDEPHVHVLPLCSAGPAEWNWDSDKATPRMLLPPVTLKNDTIEHGVLIGHLNADEHPDLIIAGKKGLHAAAGVGDGTFHSMLDTLPQSNGDGLTELFTDDPDAELPLAVGDATGDGTADFVYPDRVELGEGATFDGPRLTPWDHARLADFDGNGVLDIAASSAGSAKLDVLVSPARGLLNLFHVSTPGRVGEFAVGDFDGNLLADVAVAFAGLHPDEDLIGIMFGQPFAPLAAPVVVARVDPVAQLIVMDLEFSGNRVSDLAVVSRTFAADAPARQVSVVLGSTDRRPQAPLKLEVSDVLLRVVAAELTGDEHADIAFVSHVEGGGLDLWLLPVERDADLRTERMTQVELPLTLDWGGALIERANLDGEGPEELVVLAPSAAPDSGGSILVARSVGGAFELSEAMHTEQTFWSHHTERDLVRQLFASEGRPEADRFHATGPAQGGGAEVADLNGDGKDEVVVLGFASLEFDAEPRLLVLREADGGTLELTELSALEWPATPAGVVRPLSFALIGADADQAREIVLVSPQGGFVADLDLSAGRLGLLQHLPLPAAGRATAAAGDVTGDGVDDVVVATGDRIELYGGGVAAP